MKKIYVSHSKSFDFKTELYAPLKKLENFEFIFPHENSVSASSSKNIIKTCDALIADISIPSHSVGIEIGWADAFRVPVIFIFRKDAKPSGSLRFISQEFIEYTTVADILPQLRATLVQ